MVKLVEGMPLVISVTPNWGRWHPAEGTLFILCFGCKHDIFMIKIGFRVDPYVVHTKHTHKQH